MPMMDGKLNDYVPIVVAAYSTTSSGHWRKEGDFRGNRPCRARLFEPSSNRVIPAQHGRLPFTGIVVKMPPSSRGRSFTLLTTQVAARQPSRMFSNKPPHCRGRIKTRSASGSATDRLRPRRWLARRSSWGASRESKQPNDPPGQAGGIPVARKKATVQHQMS